jgi:hypothetical protein
VSASGGALATIERILDRRGDADEVLRDVVAALHSHYSWVGISFVEERELVLGPALGEKTVQPTRIPISYENNVVAELGVIGDEIDRALLERVAVLIAPYCLVGWDTGGEAWSP